MYLYCIPSLVVLPLPHLQLKAYARAHGKPATWNKEDVGYVARRYTYWEIDGLDEYNSPHYIRIALLGTYILLNITVVLIMMGFIPHYYNRLTEVLAGGNHHASSVYWASVIVAVVVNFCYILSYYGTFDSSHIIISPDYILQYTPNTVPAYKDCMASYYTKAVIMPISCLIELFVAICTPKNPNFPFHWRLTYCHVSRDCCSTSACSKVIQTLALWNILMFVQLLSMAAIPVCLLLVYAPLRTIPSLAVLATILLSLILVVASFIRPCMPSRAHGHRSWKQQCIRLLVLLSVVMLINVAIIIYVVFQKAAAREGASGVTLSLLPPVVLSAIGWYIKRKFFKGKTTDRYIPLTRRHSVDTEQDSDSVEDVV